MMVALYPVCGPLGTFAELDNSASARRWRFSMHRLINIIAAWLETLDVAALSTADGFLAFRLLGPTLESLAIIRAKIGEQRAEEAHDVTAQMQTDLQEGVAPKIQETLELLRRRFDDNIKPKAN